MPHRSFVLLRPRDKNWASSLLDGFVTNIAQLEQLVLSYPFRERIYAQLMLALYRSDRSTEALRVGQNARRAISAESGLDLGHVLRDLEEAIFSGDSSLDLVL